MMKLVKLDLQNFKGIKKYSIFVPGGDDFTIYGANASGKTTVVDAVFWLLFGKDSQNQSQFEIKTLDAGKVIPAIEHSVEASFLLDDVTVRLGKVYKEKYTKKRGQATKEFTGHITDHFVDGVPVKEKEFNAKVLDVAPREDLFQMLTSPTFFASRLSWKEQREILLDVCGHFTDADVIATDKELKGLPKILGGKSVDDMKKIIAGTRKKINEEIDSIPDRIDEVSRSLYDIINGEDSYRREIAEIKKSIASCKKKMDIVRAGGGKAELNLRVLEIDSKIQAERNEYDKDVAKKSSGVQEKIDSLLSVIEEIKAGTFAHKSILQITPDAIGRLEDENKGLRESWGNIDATIFNPDVCPVCDQEIDNEKSAEMFKKFQVDKAENLEKIQDLGHGNAKKIKALNERILLSESALEKTNKYIVEKNKEIDVLRDIPIEVVIPFNEVPNIRQWIAEREDVFDSLSDISDGSDAEIKKIGREISEYEGSVSRHEAMLLQIEHNATSVKRMDELKKQESSLSAEYAKLEGHLFLIEQFIRAQGVMLDNRINDKFSLVSFQLSKELINGGLQDCCEIMVGGVPYNSLNSAAKVQSGLDVIKTLSDHYGFRPCVFCDNREGVTEIPEMDCQVVSLYVSQADEDLRVEVGK